MDKIKNKFEILAGFAAIFISLSAFKDELSKCIVNLGFVSFPLSTYFLMLVVGFSISLYLFVVESTVRDMAIGRWKIFNGVIWLAYFIFVIALCTPILLFLTWGVYKLYRALPSQNDGTRSIVFGLVNIIISFLSLIISIFATKRLYKAQMADFIFAIEQQEIRDLDNANKLFQDQYYSQSVLESFKVLEAHLYQKLLDKGVRVSPHRVNDIIQLSLDHDIIRSEDVDKIEDIREMRNSAAHTSIAYTKQEAEFALNFVRELLGRGGLPLRKRNGNA